MPSEGLEIFQGTLFTRFRKIPDFVKEVMAAFITDRDSHGIGVNVKTNEGDDGSVVCFFSLCGRPSLSQSSRSLVWSDGK